MRFDAVLFDLDGTLLDTIAGITAAMNAVLAARGMPTHDEAAYKRFVGDGVEELVRRALPAGPIAAAVVADAVAAYRREYDRCWRERSRPYPGVPELLDRLQAMRLPLAVLSNKTDTFTVAMVAELLPRRLFARVCGARPGVPLKPDPTSARTVARELGATVERTLFLGDSDIDMKTALAAGMVPVGVLWGFRSAAELLAAGARHLLARPDEALALLA